MQKWKEYKLSEVAEIKYGKAHQSLADGNIPTYGSGGLMRYVEKALYDDESILIPRKGTLNNIIYKNEPFWTVDTMFYTKLEKEKVFPKFLFYQLSVIDFVSMNVGSAVPSMTVEILNDLDISLPTLPEQKAIAEVLSSLDDKIDLLHQNNQTLEQLAETIFKKWFVGSEKLETKSEKLGSLIETTLGGEWGKETAEGEFTKQVCCIRGTDIADLQTGLAERTPVRFVKEKKFESIEPKNGDLILEISGGTDDQSTGRTIYIDELNRNLFPYPLVFSNFCRLIRPKQKEYSYFLFLYIQYLYKQDEFFNLENGSSGIKNLDYKHLLFDLDYSLPKNENIIIEFNKEIEPLFEKINKNKHQIKTLQTLRDALLPKLMSGEVRVSEP